MKLLVLNGSPKGDVSVTMQYVKFIRKKFPEHEYQVLNISYEIQRIERDEGVFGTVIDAVRSADAVLFAFPLYTLLVPAQYKRFIELVFERRVQDVFRGKYTAALSTSIRFFDQLAHAYLREVCDDLGMQYVGFYSAAMYDLLEEKEQERLASFARLFFRAVSQRVPTRPENAPVVRQDFVYEPGPVIRAGSSGTRKVLILTDSMDPVSNLAKMADRLRQGFGGSVELINLHDIDMRGGCLGCCQCGYDNTCVYKDGFRDFFLKKVLPADIVVLAGTVTDRYLSSRWKMYFDRSFFLGHTPKYAGKQLGFLISGPLRQVPSLREALFAIADVSQANSLVVTDEVPSSAELDALLDAMVTRLEACSEESYIRPRTFFHEGGFKIFRDNIYGGMRVAFQADYAYYRKHKLFDFPQKDLRTRLFNAVIVPLTRVPAIRRKAFADLRYRMIEPIGKVVR
jgi:multimeric flavodoxin WrbA